MIAGDLFRRFFLRFLIGIAVALFLFIPLVHIFQRRTVNGEWREELQQEAAWFARHFTQSPPEMAARAWGMMHSATRVTFFGPDRELVADSHPDRDLPNIESLLAGEGSPASLTALETVESGGWIVMSRPSVPGFPHGLQWELIVAAVLIVCLVLLLLYPLVRSMTSTLKDLGKLAQEVSSGHFGKTLPVERLDELGSLVRAFNDMSTKLAEAERLNTRLYHDVSHELRSPLGRIQVLAQTVTLRPEEAAACLRGIEREVELLDRLVGDLLQTARVEADGGMRFETFSVQHWAAETLPRLGSEARARNIEWRFAFPTEDREARGDPQRITQAVGNLVDNAIHVLDGHPNPKIEVKLALRRATWEITVEDNGPGIPEHDRAHIFRRFYRVDEHRDRDHGGVGLGLSLVQSIANAHGGRATVRGCDGGDTRVSIELPLARE